MGIADHIQQNTGQILLVTPDISVLNLRSMNRESQPFLFHLLCVQLPNLFEQSADIGRDVFQLDGAAFNPAHLKNIIDQNQQMMAGHVNLSQIFMHDRRIVFFQCQICVSDDRVHGSPDVMGHVEKELAPGQITFRSPYLLPFNHLMLFSEFVLNVHHDCQAGKHEKNQDSPTVRKCSYNCFIAAFRDLFGNPHERGIKKQGKQHNARDGHACEFCKRGLIHCSQVENEPEQAP